MLTTGIVLLVLGVLLGFGAFGYSVMNMTGLAGAGGDDDFDQGLRRHGKAMVSMVLGTLLLTAGLFLALASAAQKYGWL